MNAKPIECDDRPLLLMLQSESAGAEDDAHLAHIEQCRRCQNRLEELAASEAEWKKAGDALSSDCFDDGWTVPAGAGSRLRFDAGRNGFASWTEAMARQLLSPPSHPEMLGRLGRYEVERMLGAGGMGIVFKAFDSELNRPVAVKVLAPFLSGSGSARMRFAREARAAAAVVHEHVVPIHNVESERDAPFLVMQYVAGESLQARLDRAGPLQLCEILRIGKQIASGLSAAHQQGLVHRDIKPSNILLEQGVERALITDFGLARAVDDASLTRSGFHPGTPQFMSPEQAAGEAVDARSDLFSLGSVLYTMCAGRSPFRAESSLAVLRRISDDEPRRLREINPSIPEWLCALIAKLMAKRPADRYQSAAEVADLLERCLAHVQQPDRVPLPPELTSRDADDSKRPLHQTLLLGARRHMVKIVASLIALSAVVAATGLLRQGGPAIAALQGEWLLVGAEQEGKPLPKDQLFNERFIVRGAKFSRPQTAPNGTEIPGESGRLALPAEPENAIDFRMWEGTAQGLYRLKDDELTVCVTRHGGPRPDSFQTRAGDSRVLNTYRRQRKPATDAAAPEDKAEPTSDNESRRKWAESWMKKVPTELKAPLNRDGAQRWLRENGFEDLKNADITLEVMKRIHPAADERSIQRDGVRSFVYGTLRSKRAEDDGAAIEVFCLFGDQDKLLALHVGPRVTEKREKKGDAKADPRLDPDAESRRFTGTWRVVERSTGGVEQKAEIGQTVRILDRRMGEVRLDLDPNRNPRTIDVVFVDGPEAGKVLRGIYEWIPDWKSDDRAASEGTGEALRICTFVRPDPDRPDRRPHDFQPGKDVDTAVWQCLSHDPPTPEVPNTPQSGQTDSPS